ncbi:MAG: bifunctional riboflavin kinase/FMN adenylyltransferase [Phycisphaeraceae bacterium]|nr:bifunctional riboflavin kinase/FMN adenylyltransferase [Phycisphaeraceae bacterium]
MPSVLTIGTFDGVHLGHQSLARRAGELARQAGGAARATAIVFDPNPVTVLRPSETKPRLCTFNQKAAWLHEAGVDDIVRLEPTPALLACSAEEFLRRTIEQYAPIAFVEGEDFRFGKGRAGDMAMLRAAGTTSGFRVEVVDPVEVALSDDTAVVASSTMTRWLVHHGRVRDAARMLGRPYSIQGSVVHGERRGRTIGFPTANIDTDCMHPADGVYAGRARLPDGRAVPAAVSIGSKPHFGGESTCVEAYLMIEPSADRRWSTLPGLSEYQWPIELEFLAWIRDQAKFESLETLVAQITRDCERVRSIVACEMETTP